MSSKKKQNNIPIIATIVFALIATILAIVAIFVIMKNDSADDQNSSQPGDITSSAYITPEYQAECQEAAYDLLKNSHEILRLFVTEGLYHEDEPYGNRPGDGYYTVNSTEYTSLQQIEDLVRSVYVSDAAERILKNIDGNGLAVYGIDVEPVIGDDTTSESGRNDGLGISENFTPDPSKSWTSCSIIIDYIEEGICSLTVALDPEESTVEAGIEPDGTSVLEMTMTKLEDGWRLTDFVTRNSAQ